MTRDFFWDSPITMNHKTVKCVVAILGVQVYIDLTIKSMGWCEGVVDDWYTVGVFGCRRIRYATLSYASSRTSRPVWTIGRPTSICRPVIRHDRPTPAPSLQYPSRWPELPSHSSAGYLAASRTAAANPTLSQSVRLWVQQVPPCGPVRCKKSSLLWKHAVNWWHVGCGFWYTGGVPTSVPNATRLHWSGFKMMPFVDLQSAAFYLHIWRSVAPYRLPAMLFEAECIPTYKYRCYFSAGGYTAT